MKYNDATLDSMESAIDAATEAVQSLVLMVWLVLEDNGKHFDSCSLVERLHLAESALNCDLPLLPVYLRMLKKQRATLDQIKRDYYDVIPTY